MDDLSTPKQHREGSYSVPMISSKKTQVGYDSNLGFWGQPKSFYAGLAAGSVFLASVLGLLLTFLSRI